MIFSGSGHRYDSQPTTAPGRRPPLPPTPCDKYRALTRRSPDTRNCFSAMFPAAGTARYRRELRCPNGNHRDNETGGRH
ncbi:hypothetical protein FDG2_1104 [Candidatus Protofrankia californiensis]|uniref:Uncharacterized protein n=1 Tax=Candidatus Protofrankia californiensis TaxID=1839754 RepID=A0A1C3NV19_9ACTN|nr:hypothetical protein FDG2_1104 [Candidatus Protofrankia californiensis]